MATETCVRAFRVTLWDVESILATTSPGKARAYTWMSARGAGYYTARFTEVRVKRAYEFDGLAGDSADQAKKGPVQLGWKEGIFSFGCLRKEKDRR